MPALSNARHEAFAQNLAKGRTADAAYEEAGFAPNRGNAARLKANESILGRVAELQGEAAESTVTTVESLLTAGWSILRDAQKAEDFGAASQTLERVAKIAGLWVDKQKNDNTNWHAMMHQEPPSHAG